MNLFLLKRYEILPVQVQAQKPPDRLQIKSLIMNWNVQAYLDAFRRPVSFGKWIWTKFSVQVDPVSFAKPAGDIDYIR